MLQCIWNFAPALNLTQGAPSWNLILTKDFNLIVSEDPTTLHSWPAGTGVTLGLQRLVEMCLNWFRHPS